MLTEFNPRIIIKTSIVQGTHCIRIEKVVINEITAKIPYNNGGEKPDAEKIVVDGPDTYFSKLPTNCIVDELTKNDNPAEISYTAGTYTCNQASYYLLHKCKTKIKLVDSSVFL